MENTNNLTLDTVVKYNMKGGSVEQLPLRQLLDTGVFGSEEELYFNTNLFIKSGRAFVVNTKNPLEEMADNVARELLAVNKSKDIQEEHKQRLHHGQDRRGTYQEVQFPAKTLLHAQEMMQSIMRNFNIDQSKLGINMMGNDIIVIVKDCPVATFPKIDRAFGFKRATDAVTGTVEKTANSLVNTTDLVLNDLAVPVAKTVIGTSAKVAKSLVGLTAKLGGIFVGEITKSGKQCVNEIKQDGYIAEAKGEVQETIHSVRRSMGGSMSFGLGGGGQIVNN